LNSLLGRKTSCWVFDSEEAETKLLQFKSTELMLIWNNGVDF